MAFLGYVAATTGASAAAVLSPAFVATGLGIIGTAASVAGNEGAIRFGRKRLIATVTLASIFIGGTLGFLGSTSYAFAAVLMTLYGIVIWLDSRPLSSWLTTHRIGSPDQYRKPDNSLDYHSRSSQISYGLRW